MQPLALDAPLAADPMHLVGAAVIVLVLLEVRQDIVPAPTGEAELAPAVVIGGLAAHIDHAVDRRAAADHPAARIGDGAAVEARLGDGLEHPIGALIADGVEIADGNVEPNPVVTAARFEKQDFGTRIGGKTIGEQAPSRTSADDDVVVGTDVGHGAAPIPFSPPGGEKVAVRSAAG